MSKNAFVTAEKVTNELKSIEKEYLKENLTSKKLLPKEENTGFSQQKASLSKK